MIELLLAAGVMLAGAIGLFAFDDDDETSSQTEDDLEPVEIEGTEGDDTLSAGENEALFGYEGADVLSTTEGGSLYGGAGDDELSIQDTGTAYGGDGNDTISFNDRTQFFDDRYDLEYNRENNGYVDTDVALFGGDGDDTIEVELGFDHLIGQLDPNVISVTGGEGADTFVITEPGTTEIFPNDPNAPEQLLVIADFNPSEDILDISDLLSNQSFAEPAEIEIVPSEDGSYTDIVGQFNTRVYTSALDDGREFYGYIRLEGVDAEQAANITFTSDLQVGTDSEDTITGAEGDTVIANDGNDVVFGGSEVRLGAGDDMLTLGDYDFVASGGEGNDTITMASGGSETELNGSIYGGDGDDVITLAQNYDYTPSSDLENFERGQAADVIGGTGNDTISFFQGQTVTGGDSPAISDDTTGSAHQDGDRFIFNLDGSLLDRDPALVLTGNVETIDGVLQATGTIDVVIPDGFTGGITFVPGEQISIVAGGGDGNGVTYVHTNAFIQVDGETVLEIQRAGRFDGIGTVTAEDYGVQFIRAVA